VTYQKEREFIRLVNNEPLVLSVSALCDFLWDDFVRDARPTVNYLIDRYNIRQLSRFGKELFDYLYNGGAVTPLVSLDDVETYFREKQNGLAPNLPGGYKPENAFWIGLFVDITNAPAWSQLVSISCGNQFNAGNNATNILNELSEVLEADIEEGTLPIEELNNGSQKLKELRDQFMKAKEEGNDELAARLRIEGKKLGKELEKAIEQSREQLQPQIARAVDKVNKQAEELENELNTMAGANQGVGAHGDDLEIKRRLAKKLKNNRTLKEVIRKLGGLRRAWNDRKRAKRYQSNYSDITGAKFSDEITKVFPAELALAATEAGNALFALKYAQKTLLTKDYEAKVKDVQKGPVVMYVDISGSMSGEPEVWSKAITYVIAEECLEQNRELQVHLFDTVVQKSITLNPAKNNNEKLLNFIMTWITKGGTSFCSVLEHAMSVATIDEKADVLLITDGDASVTDPFIRRINSFKNDKNIQWNSFCIGRKAKVLNEFSDEVHTINIYDDPESSDLLQLALR